MDNINNVYVVKILYLDDEKIFKKFTNFHQEKKKIDKINFLFESIQNELYSYKIDENREIYEFFGTYFLLIRDNILFSSDKNYNKEQLEKLYKFQSDFDNVICKQDGENFAYLFNGNCDNNIISLAIRHSKTLKLTNNNSYDNDDLKAVFDNGNLAVMSKIADSKDKFERFLILFVLALAYNKKIFNFLNKTSSYYNDKNFKKMIEIRDEYLKFDLNAYFDNPIKPTKIQVYEIYKIISDKLATKNLHSELKLQISDLVQVIYEKQKTKQDRKITIFGTIIGFLSLIATIVTIIYS
ncbi:hypothetical protein U5B43_01845 [Campylobacter sp. 9BO]|uniref:hypothetical protein n=1 Tax=Campylobacter sp. 9BO TaxID=3424759 RepID=UPI003D32989D